MDTDLSNSEYKIFSDRAEAAELLSRQLSHYRSLRPVVLGIPRGAFPAARIIANFLDADLDAVLVSKIGAPGNPDYAIGAVNEDGVIWLSEAARRFELPEDYIRRQAEILSSQLLKRRELYSELRTPVDLRNRCVIIVDDGTMSGSNLMAAIQYVRERSPAQIVAAAAVMSEEAWNLIRAQVDETVALMIPHEMVSVSEFFILFSDISENVVTRILVDEAEESRHRRRTAPITAPNEGETPPARPPLS